MRIPVIIGTRGSDLAMWQANHIKDQITALGVHCELKIITTTGDSVQQLSFDKIEGKGFFTKEIEDELLAGSIDIAVHSHKDLETTQPEGLHIAAVSKRANPSELLIIRPESVDPDLPWKLKQNAIVGTSSARRKSQLLDRRKDIIIRDIRGNVPTRVRKLRENEFDAILLAKAGIDRLQADLSDLFSITLDPEEFVPAPAQGVLAIECRTSDKDINELLQKLEDSESRVIVELERTVLRNLDGGCQLPLGVFAKKINSEFEVHVTLAKEWDSPLRRFVFVANDAPFLAGIISDRLREK